MASPFDDEHAPLFSVGQVAEILGVQAAFVRRLDTEAVVQPSRSQGGQRRYSRREIERIERVSLLAGEGLNLAGIRRIIELERNVAELEATVARLRSELLSTGRARGARPR